MTDSSSSETLICSHGVVRTTPRKLGYYQHPYYSNKHVGCSLSPLSALRTLSLTFTVTEGRDCDFTRGGARNCPKATLYNDDDAGFSFRAIWSAQSSVAKGIRFEC